MILINPHSVNYFSKNLRYLIKRFDITQAQLAFQVGKGQNTISNWINGNSSPDLDDLLVLYQFFGVAIDYLVLEDLEKGNLIPESHVEKMKNNGKGNRNLSGNLIQQNKRVLYSGNQQVTEVSEADPVSLWAILGQLKNIDQKIDLLVVSAESKPKKGHK